MIDILRGERSFKMKNKSTKQMWIYAGVLFAVALILILVTTITQWKLIGENGNLQVLDSFTQSSNQRIEQLTGENVKLKEELTKTQKELSSLKEALVSSENENAYMKDENEKLYSLIDSYLKGNKKDVREKLKSFSKEQLDAVLPGFYDEASNL